MITFPEGAALADVTAAVLDALLEAQRQRLERVFDIHQRFTRIALGRRWRGRDRGNVARAPGCPVAVIDTDGRATVIVPSDAVADLDLAATPGIRQSIRAGDHEYGDDRRAHRRRDAR